MKSLYMVFLLYYFAPTGKLEVSRAVDKCSLSNAHETVRFMTDTKHFVNDFVPLDGFVLEKFVTDEEWSRYCYDPRYRGSEVIIYGENRDQLLLLPRRECP